MTILGDRYFPNHRLGREYAEFAEILPLECRIFDTGDQERPNVFD